MELDLALELPRGLDQSILIAVLVGLLVLLAMTEAFGWVFVGVIVPGYLASVLIAQPPTGIAVVVDSVLTFVVARGLAGVLGRTRTGTEFFGRERFFLIVLVSVLVRQHSQTWIWPLVFSNVDDLGIRASFELGFFSIGLVLVPLTANILWKLHLSRGLAQLLVVSLVTYAALQLWLLPATNLSYSSLEISYENTAIDFLANAKVYIIMLSAAYLAAHLNVRYGWDFNGILVPSLLSLLWLTPAKLGITFAEAVVLYGGMKLLPKLPGFGTLNLEGPRKMALVFTMGVALKWILAAIVGPRFPAMRVTDLFGFGYLLSTLLALKMIDRKSIRGVLLPTGLTSFGGFALGSLLGFALELFTPSTVPRALETTDAVASTRLLRTPMGTMAAGRVYAADLRGTAPTHAELVAYDSAWEAVSDWIRVATEGTQRRAQDKLAPLDIAVHQLPEQLDGRTVYALVAAEHEREQARHWETALVVPGARGPVVHVPKPASETPSAEVAAQVCRAIRCRAVVVAGRDWQGPREQLVGTTPYAIARARLGEFTSVEIRADSTAVLGTPTLHVESGLPEDLDLEALWPQLELDWSPPPDPLGEWGSRSRSVVLRAHPADLQRAIASQAPSPQRTESMMQWLRARMALDQRTDGEGYVAPSEAELRVLERFVTVPLLEHAVAEATGERLELLATYASLLEYQVLNVADCGRGSRCLALVDSGRPSADGWGTVVVRLGESKPIAIEVPRPQKSLGTWALGAELWIEARARALLIAGADRSTGPHNADPITMGNLRTPFQAAHQAIDQLAATEAVATGEPPLIAQVAGLAAWRPIDDELVVGLGRPLLDRGQVPIRLRALIEGHGPLDWLASWRMSDGSPELYDLSGSGIPQLQYSHELGGANAASLWFSTTVRDRYRSHKHAGERRRLQRAGLETEITPEVAALLEGTNSDVIDDPSPELEQRYADHLDLARRYARTHNVHLLRELVDRAARGDDIDIGAGVGGRTGLPLLQVECREGPEMLRGLVMFDVARERHTRVEASDAGASDRVSKALFRRDRAITVHSVVREAEE